MLIINLNNGENLEKALKTLKSKVIKTKQNQILFDRKEYTKPSIKRRSELLKAIYVEKKRKS